VEIDSVITTRCASLGPSVPAQLLWLTEKQKTGKERREKRNKCHKIKSQLALKALHSCLGEDLGNKARRTQRKKCVRVLWFSVEFKKNKSQSFRNFVQAI